MNMIQCLLTQSDCYKAGTKIKPIGVMVHSTGATTMQNRNSGRRE